MKRAPRRRIPGIGWVYLAVIVGIIRWATGAWRLDGGFLLVFVFLAIGLFVYFEAARGIVDRGQQPCDEEDES